MKKFCLLAITALLMIPICYMINAMVLCCNLHKAYISEK